MKLKIFLVFSTLLLILTLTVVSANENVTGDIAQIEEEDVLENAVGGNTFADIQKSVDSAKANDVIELNGTYTSSGKSIKVNKNLVFDGGLNGATLDGKKVSGIIETSTNKYTITLKNINFINAKNSAFLDKDSFNSEGKLIIDNCNFTDNVGTENGAVSCGKCVVTNSNFKNNVAKGVYDKPHYVSWGGAICAESCELTNCNFEKNTALNEGGAIYAFGLKADKCNFYQNSANEYGGAIYSPVEIKNSNFTSNSAKSYNGGAIYGDGKIQNCIFNSNSAKYNGGAVEGSVNVINSVFSNNKACYAGAIHSNYDKVQITNTTFKSNEEAAVIADRILLKNPNKTLKDGKILNNDLKPIVLIKVDVKKKLTTVYRSGKDLKIKLTKKISNKPAPAIGVGITVYKGKKIFDGWKYTREYFSTNSKGAATFKASKLPAGKYTLYLFEAYLDGDGDFFTCPIPQTKVTLKVTKAKTIVKAPKVTAKFKKTKYFKVTVKNKLTKKPINKLKVKVKVYTGKKSKTYTIKTNKKGIAKLNTKKLSWGTHKVVISPKNTSYKLSAKSQIRIR